MVLTAGCLAVGWFRPCCPTNMNSFGKHIAASAGFVANFVLLNEAGYFDNAAETKPLLHIWSLGVEEQFYIVWPALLLYTFTKWRWRIRWVILVIAVASFAANVYTIRTNINDAFYSPPHALLGIDGRRRILARLVFARCVSVHSAWKLPATAITSRLCWRRAYFSMPVFFLNRRKRIFRAGGRWDACLLGAYCIIAAGRGAWINRRILASKPMVWVGLISYPLYIWHWPLLVFYRIAKNRMPSPAVGFAIVLLSIALAWLTYVFIEKPIAFRRFPRENQDCYLLCIFMMCCRRCRIRRMYLANMA